MKKALTVLAVLVASACLFLSCGNKTKADNSLEDLKARGVFVIGLDDAFPPMGYRDSNNEIVGYDIDLAKEVARRLGVEFKAQPINWDSKELELKTGNIDCIWNGFTITEERKSSLNMTKPYLNNAQVVVVRNDSKFNTLADMKGASIGLQQGSSAEEAVNSNKEFKDSLAKILPFEQNLMALQDLNINGVDGVVMDIVVAEYTIKNSGFPFHTLKEALVPEEYGIGFRKGDDKLTAEVEKTLEEMAADGTVAKISEKWFGTDISVIGK